MNFRFILCRLFNIQGSEPYSYDFIKKKNFFIDFLKLTLMIETTKLYIPISTWMTLTFVQGHSCIRNQKLGCQFSCKFKYRFG